MSEDGRRPADDDDGDGGPAGMVLMVGTLDLLLFGTALYAFSLGASAVGMGVLVLASVLTGIDVWLYRRGSF